MPNDKPTKSKLLKLKEWLTVPEAARHLSNVFEEEVTEADILRLALDGHLKLSVNLVNGAYARYGKVVAYEGVIWKKYNSEAAKLLLKLSEDSHEKINYHEFNDIMDFTVMKSLNIDDERYLNLDKEVQSISGIWDLSMVGAERNDVENKYQYLTDGPEFIRVYDGAFVEKQNEVMCQLQERFNDKNKAYSAYSDPISGPTISKIENRLRRPDISDSEKIQLQKEIERCIETHESAKKMKSDSYYPADGLPEDSVLVVRTQALMDLINSFSSDLEENAGPLQFETPEGTTWRDIRLVIRNNDFTEILEVNGPEGHLGNYKPEAIGFRGHSGPGQKWTLLTQFAKMNGTIEPRGLDAIKPVVSRLRKTLREIFPGIEGDPVPWRKGSWRAAFHIEVKRYEKE